MALAALLLLSCSGGDGDGAASGAAVLEKTSAPIVTDADGPTRVDDGLKDDGAHAKRYAEIADQVQADPKAAAAGKTFEGLRADLQSIADRAEDRFLRANAAVLLGSLLEERGDPKGAIAYYRHASKLVPDDAGPFMALAVGLAAGKQYAEAAVEQATAARLDPNNVENWLALGELRLRAGDESGAASAYVDYERVRKSLIDGLTGRDKEGGYLVSVDERVACAHSLAAAADTGTAFALLYALETETEAKVRQAVAEVMGVQRFKAYEARLTERSKTESDPDARTALQWALSEVLRDPITVEKDDRAVLPDGDPRAADEAAVDAVRSDKPPTGSPPGEPGSGPKDPP